MITRITEELIQIEYPKEAFVSFVFPSEEDTILITIGVADDEGTALCYVDSMTRDELEALRDALTRKLKQMG